MWIICRHAHGDVVIQKEKKISECTVCHANKILRKGCTYINACSCSITTYPACAYYNDTVSAPEEEYANAYPVSSEVIEVDFIEDCLACSTKFPEGTSRWGSHCQFTSHVGSLQIAEVFDKNGDPVDPWSQDLLYDDVITFELQYGGSPFEMITIFVIFHNLQDQPAGQQQQFFKTNGFSKMSADAATTNNKQSDPILLTTFAPSPAGNSQYEAEDRMTFQLSLDKLPLSAGAGMVEFVAAVASETCPINTTVMSSHVSINALQPRRHDRLVTPNVSTGANQWHPTHATVINLGSGCMGIFARSPYAQRFVTPLGQNNVRITN